MQISLGDARSYYITTARNDLGVIFATSEAGGCIPSPRPLPLTRYRCNDGAGVVAGDAVPENGEDRKAQVRQTRESVKSCYVIIQG